MSFLSDLFSGNTSNLGHDLAPSNIFSDVGTDIAKNPVLDIAALVGGGLLTAGLADPALLGLGAAGGAADLSTMGGAAAAGLGAGIDPTAAAADAALGLGAEGATALPYTADSLAAQDLPSWWTTGGPEAAPGSGVMNYSGGALPDVGTAFGTSPAAGGSTNLAAAATAGGNAPDVLSVNPSDIVNISGTAGSPAAAPAAGGGIWNNITGALTGPTAKAVGTVAGLGGLGYNLYQGYQNQQAQKAITNQINQTAAEQAAVSKQDTAAAQPLIAGGTELTQFLQTGTLPPAFQAQVKTQTDAAKAAIIQGYATRGQSTNPSDNSALAQDLMNVDTQAQVLQANLESTLSTAGTNMISTANQLLASGASAASISGQLPIMVAQLNLNLSNATSGAISNFAAALNGGKLSANTNAGTASPVGQVNLAQATNTQQPLTFTS